VLDNPRSPKVRAVAKLAKKQRRNEARLFLVEGPQATREALSFRPELVEDIFVTPAARDRNHDLMTMAMQAGVEVTVATDAVIDHMADTVTPQGLVAVSRYMEVPLESVLGPTTSHLVLLHQVKDPGNMGNIIRTADAAGVDAVIVTADSVDVFNPKVVRASTGSLFHIPIVMGVELAPTITALKAAGVTVFAADAGGRNLGELRGAGALQGPLAWLLGNEAHGLAPEDEELADTIVSVPMFGSAESLSLQTAAAVCIYEAAFAKNSG
jgi:TrmH family RNA methyltransferase